MLQIAEPTRARPQYAAAAAATRGLVHGEGGSQVDKTLRLPDSAPV